MSTNEEEGPSIVTDTATAPILRLRKIEMVFGGVHALRGVDFDVAQGDRLAILGPNGAGKTTLFNVIAGDFAPTAGSIEIRGRDVTTQPARTRPGLGVARTYQVTRLFPGLSVEDNLFVAIIGKEGGHYRGVKLARDADTRERARAAARQVWLHEKLDTMVSDLSHGEQRQLEVGLAIHHHSLRCPKTLRAYATPRADDSASNVSTAVASWTSRCTRRRARRAGSDPCRC